MMKPLTLSLMLSLSMFSVAAHANVRAAEPSRQAGEADLASHCPELNLTQAQKDQLKLIKEETKTKLMTHKTQLKEAREALTAAFADAGVVQATVVEKEAAVKSHVDAILDVAFEASNQIVFTVLNKDQRAPAVACMKKIKKEFRKKWLERRCKQISTEQESDIEGEVSEI